MFHPSRASSGGHLQCAKIVLINLNIFSKQASLTTFTTGYTVQGAHTYNSISEEQSPYNYCLMGTDVLYIHSNFSGYNGKMIMHACMCMCAFLCSYTCTQVLYYYGQPIPNVSLYNYKK